MQLVLLVLFSCAFVIGEPIVIRTSLGKAQADHGKAKASDVYEAQVAQGDQKYHNKEGYNKENEKKYVNAQDSGSYGEEKEDKKLKEHQGGYADDKFHKNQGANEANFGKKVGHKKKYHKAGFHNTYHKDESGSNSSYYDDGNDEADEYVQDSRKGAYGDAKSAHNRGGYEERNGYVKNHANQGGYNNGGSYDKEAANRNEYKDKKYYDNRNHEGRLKSGDEYGERDQYSRQQKYTHPVYHTNYKGGYYPEDVSRREDNFHPSKRVITVYEDPRYLNRDYDRYDSYTPGYESERVRLDIRPPIFKDERHYRRPLYDNDYYY